MSLPSLVALNTTVATNRRKCLGVKPESEGGVAGKLQHGVPLLDPKAKFAIEHANKEGGLIHIRSVYTNKYFVRQSSTGDYLVAGASEALEDESVWNCTLFKPSVVTSDDGKLQVTFVHVQTNRIVRLLDDFYFGIRADDSAVAISDVINFKDLVVLPPLVAFKGDNGKYLKAYHDQHKHKHQQFGDDDLGSEYVPQEVHYDDDGNIRIKSVYFGGFWQNDEPHEWVWANSDGTTIQSLYKAIYVRNEPVDGTKASQDVIAIYSLRNNKFLKRLTNYRLEDCLNAATPTVTMYARLQVCEPVLRKTIREVRYHVDHARVFDVVPVVLKRRTQVNDSDVTITIEEYIDEEVSETKTVENSISVTTGITASMEVDLIPFIAKGSVELKLETTTGLTFGKSVSTTRRVGSKVIGSVPPKRKAIIQLISSKGKCNVPFSYVQVDYLTDGRTITKTLDDGVFTGIDYFSVDGTFEVEPL